MSTLAHVIALDPTEAQTHAFARAAGTARFTYNWALAQCNAAEKVPDLRALKRHFNAIKRTEWPWMMESPRDANSQPFADLQKAWSAYFASLSGKRKGPKIARPSFHRKGKGDSFYVANDKLRFDLDGGHVVLPLVGRVRITESLRLAGKIMGARVRRVADRWYLAVQVEGEFGRPTTPVNEIVGVDLGIKHAVVTSAGEAIDAPKPLKQNRRALARAQRVVARRKKGSKNREKAKRRVARIHARIASVREDFMHKVTTKLARENQAVVIEDLNVKGMVRNHKLAQAISDVGFRMFRTLLTYKGPLYGCEVIVADRWFPSSKRCSVCGSVRETLTLVERVYRCDACGHTEDRDVNAAKNLETYPRLAGNAARAETPMDTSASTRRKPRRASAVVEVGTQP